MLLEEGFQVTSVDASDKMLKYALKERWERRKEEPFDRWGAGTTGAGRSTRTPTPHPGAGDLCPEPLPAPRGGLRPLAWVLLGQVALLQGPAGAGCSARQAQAMALACLLVPGWIQHPQGPRKGWGWGSCMQGRLPGR